MSKKLINLGIIIIMLSVQVLSVQAANLQQCQIELEGTLEDVMGIPKDSGLHGYLKQLGDLASTNLPTHQLIEEVEQLARDARIELRGVCSAVERFDGKYREGEAKFYLAAYSLNTCFEFKGEEQDQDRKIAVITFCRDKSEEMLDKFLDDLRAYMLKQAVRTSMDPVIQRMRSLNERLIVLMNEYSRVVNNFFTFSFRLGDTITGEWD